MSYDVVWSEAAEAEADDAYFWLLGRSPNYAAKWLSGLRLAVDSLSDFPEPCPLAREHMLFSSPVRQHLYGKYRILFSIVDADGDGTLDTVRILHARHGARRDLDEERSNNESS